MNGKILRMIDVNINRVSESLRVLEDLSRFYFEDSPITDRLRILRHEVRSGVADIMPDLLRARDAANDIGRSISTTSGKIDDKASAGQVIAANFKRVQEGLRVVEENLKLSGEYNRAKYYECHRFDSYTIEKKFAASFKKRTLMQAFKEGIYCITAEEHSLGRSNIRVVREMIDAGVKIIQYREKDKSLLQKYRECEEIRKMSAEAGVVFIVNDHIDIALAVGADGVHIGQDDLPIEKVRELVGDEMIIGISTHSPEQAQDAEKKGADYIGAGPVYKTATKKDVCEPVGLEYIGYVAENINIPFVAIGGIKEYNIADVYRKGARCIALVTEITGAENIGEKIGRLNAILKNCI